MDIVFENLMAAKGKETMNKPLGGIPFKRSFEKRPCGKLPHF